MQGMNEIPEAAIARRAHEIWEEQGRPEGRSQDHWEQARTELAEAAAMAAQGLAGTAEATLADEAAAATEQPPPAPAPAVKITRRKAKPAAASSFHETVDGAPDSLLDNLSPTPKGRSRKKSADQ